MDSKEFIRLVEEKKKRALEKKEAPLKWEQMLEAAAKAKAEAKERRQRKRSNKVQKRSEVGSCREETRKRARHKHEKHSLYILEDGEIDPKEKRSRRKRKKWSSSDDDDTESQRKRTHGRRRHRKSRSLSLNDDGGKRRRGHVCHVKHHRSQEEESTDSGHSGRDLRRREHRVHPKRTNTSDSDTSGRLKGRFGHHFGEDEHTDSSSGSRWKGREEHSGRLSPHKWNRWVGNTEGGDCDVSNMGQKARSHVDPDSALGADGMNYSQ